MKKGLIGIIYLNEIMPEYAHLFADKINLMIQFYHFYENIDHFS